MNINEILDQIERGLDGVTPEAGLTLQSQAYSGHTMRAIIAHIRELEARAEMAEAKILEQARLLGMGAERELALLSRAERAEAENKRLREALGDLLSWFPDEQPKPKWELPAGEHGADDAIEAALKAMEATDV